MSGGPPRVPRPPEPAGPPENTVWPYIGVGCLTTIVGFFGGGMIAMLFGKITDLVTQCQPAEGLPVCGWWRYWFTGGIIGAVILPIIAVRRMRRGRRMADESKSND